MFKNEILAENIRKIELNNVRLSLMKAIEEVGIGKESKKKENEILIIIICKLLKGYRINDFTWEKFCMLQNLNIKELLEENKKIFDEYYLGKINSIIKRYKKGLETPGAKYYSELVSQFYIALSELDERSIINEFKDLLIVNTRVNLNHKNQLEKNFTLTKNVFTNFPINTNKNAVISHVYKSKNNCGYTKININCNTENVFLKKLYSLYWDFALSDGSMAKGLRMFFYYFSIECTNFNKFCYQSFDMEFLRYSYKRLSEVHKKLEGLLNKRIRFRHHVVDFYRFLNIQIKKLNLDNCLSKIEIEALNNRSIYKILKYDYDLHYFNPYEKPPISDRFCIMPNEYTLLNSHSKNNSLFLIDLNNVDILFRNDVKDFLWFDDGNVKVRFDKLSIIFKFLNQASIYNKKIINLEKTKNFNEIIQNKFLYEYRKQLEFKYKNTNTLKSILKPIRKFLIYYKDKYQLSSEAFHILSLKGLEISSGGKVITDKDLKAIYNEFTQSEKRIQNGRLYTIIFEIFIYSNLRIGEIINLKKDCIIEENGKTYITFISKTGNKEPIKVVIGEEVKRLINEAINITKLYRAETIIDNYLFIRPYSRKIRNNIRLNFYTRFKNVIKKLANNLENSDYYPYNIRHTYMNKICEEAQRGNLSFSQIESITNDSIKTIRKYYQQRDKVELMVEIMAGVTISDVSINGTILKSDISKDKSVKDNLGKCKEEECTFDIAECLICKQFITFTNRKNSFINLIEKCQTEILETKNEFIKKEKIAEKKLLAKYLAEILKIKEKENE